MEQNKYEALRDWLLNYTQLTGWLYFNVTNIEQNNTSLNSVPGDSELNQFIDGSAEKELIFAIDMVKAYDTGTSDTNLDAIQEVNAFSKWITEHNQAQNFPDFDGCIVSEIKVLESAPSASVDNEQGLIKYQFQCRISYLETKGE